ncbi:MAG: pyridoxamine 5'-phosphate oxidase family protein [Haloarculaceae archaeon]
MADRIGQSMSTDEIRELMTEWGHGVLSLGHADDAGVEGYGIPMSFGYVESEDRCLVQVIRAAEGERKWAFLDQTDWATLTVVDWTAPDDWRSVIAAGPLRAIDREDLSDTAAAIYFDQRDDASPVLRREDVPGVERRWYELQIETMPGRMSPLSSAFTG